MKSASISFDAHYGDNPARPAGYGAITITTHAGDCRTDFEAAIGIFPGATVRYHADDPCTQGSVEGVLPSACDIVRAELERRGFDVEWSIDERADARKRGAA